MIGQLAEPRCQDLIGGVRCTGRAFWVVLDSKGAAHHLICKMCGLLYQGVDLRPVSYVSSAQFEWANQAPGPERSGWYGSFVHRPPRKAELPPAVPCLICQDGSASPYWCGGCAPWVAAQPPLGKRVLGILGRAGLSVRLVRAEPHRLRALDYVGPKSVGWLLGVELPRRVAA